MLLLSLKNDCQSLLFESGRCENSFVDYKINYEKLCYSLRKIWTDPLYLWFNIHANNEFISKLCVEWTIMIE